MDKGRGAEQVTRLGKGWKSQAGCKYDQQPPRWKPFDSSLKGSIAIFALLKCRWVWVFPAGWFSDWLARLLPRAAQLLKVLTLSFAWISRSFLRASTWMWELTWKCAVSFPEILFHRQKQMQFWESSTILRKFFFSSSHLANTVAIVGCKYKYCLMGTCLRVLVLPVLSLMYRAINSFRPEGWMSKFSYSTESWILQLLPRTEEVGN